MALALLAAALLALVVKAVLGYTVSLERASPYCF